MYILDYNNPIKAFAPLNQGLVSWYVPFIGMSSKNIRDLCNKNNGTVINNVLWPTNAINPTSFNGIFPSWEIGGGTTNYIEIPDSSSLRITGSFTLSVFFLLHNLALAGDWPAFIAKGANSESAGLNHNYALAIENGAFGTGHAINFLYENSSGTNFSTRITITLETKRWYHLVGVFSYNGGSNSNRFVYLDGKLIGTGATSVGNVIPDIGATTLRLGHNNASGSTADASIDGHITDCKIYNRALKAEEIWKMRLSALGGYINELNYINIYNINLPTTTRRYGSIFKQFINKKEHGHKFIN